MAKRLSPEWRGGSYYAAGRRGAKPPDRNSTAHVGLFYISKWATETAAKEFAEKYAASLTKRYTGLRHLPADPANSGLNKYSSDDGALFIRQTGTAVVAVESFDDDSAMKLIEAGVKQAGASVQAHN